MRKMNAVFLFLMVLFIVSPLAFAEEKIILAPEEVKWDDLVNPDLPPGAKVAVLEGDPNQPGPVSLRLKFPAGYAVPPHTHDKVERVTVLSGKFSLAMGMTHENPKVLSPGGFFVLPPGTVHNAVAEEETVLQINTNGPWSIKVVK